MVYSLVCLDGFAFRIRNEAYFFNLMIAHSCKLADPGLRYPKLQILELLYFGFTRKKSFSRKKSVDLGINFGEKDDIATTNFRNSQLINDLLPPPPLQPVNQQERRNFSSKTVQKHCQLRNIPLVKSFGRTIFLSRFNW